MTENVLLIGASSNKERYAHKAMALLLEYGHNVIPVNPRETEILGVKTVGDVGDVDVSIDTASVYVRPDILRSRIDALVALNPRRVILNPGTEDRDIKGRLEAAGIDVVEACTLVLLRTEQF